MTSLKKIDVLFTLLFLAIFLTGIIVAMDYSSAGSLFPTVTACAGVVLILAQLIVGLREPIRQESDLEGKKLDYVDIAPDADIPNEVVRQRGLGFLGWVLGFYVAIYLVGFQISVPFFIAAYLRVECKAAWWKIALLAAVSVYLTFYHFKEILGVVWPKPLIADFISLPWI